jgi:hypothetical protein
MLLAIVAHSNQLAAAVCLRRQASRCRIAKQSTHS